jgi:hypothetical protein
VKITKLRGNNSQLPEEKSIGDLVVLSSKDLFCWDGVIWQLVGARFLPKDILDIFLSYVSEGLPDPQTIEWDLKYLLDIHNLLGKIKHKFQLPDKLTSLEEKEKFCKKLIDTFINRVVEVAALCEKNSKEVMERGD